MAYSAPDIWASHAGLSPRSRRASRVSPLLARFLPTKDPAISSRSRGVFQKLWRRDAAIRSQWRLTAFVARNQLKFLRRVRGTDAYSWCDGAILKCLSHAPTTKLDRSRRARETGHALGVGPASRPQYSQGPG